MSDFAPGGPQIPAPPFEIPTPDIPPADFVTIGQQFATGMAKATPAAGGKPGAFAWIWDLVAAIVSALLNLIFDTIALLIKKIFDTAELGRTGMDQLMAQIVAGVTGIPGSPVQFAQPFDRGARAGVATQIVKTIQDALATGQPGAGAGGLKPGSSGAEAFLGFTTHMAIEGWLLGVVCDLVSVHELEQVADLKESLEGALGLNRLARRALAAPMKILVEDPYTWLLNSQYRPAILSPEILVRQYLRGLIDRPTLDTFAGYLGHAPANVEALINFHKLHPSVAQLSNLSQHQQIDSTTFNALLKAQGYDDVTATMVITADQNAQLDAWARQLIAAAFSDFAARLVDQQTVQTIIEQSKLPPAEQTKLTEILNLKAAGQRKRFTIAEGESLVKKGLWTLDQFRELATYHGYSSEDETALELLLLGEITTAADAATKKAAAAKAKADAAAVKAQAAKDKAANAAAAAEAKGVSIAKYETLVLDGLKTIDQYKTFLAGKGQAPDNITALATVLQDKLDKATAAAAAAGGLGAAAKAKNLDLAQLETAAKAGVITVVEFGARLEGIGFKPEDIALLEAVLTDQLQAAQVKAQAKADAAAKAKAKGVDLAQEQRGVRLGLITVDEYAAFLDKLGFAPEDRDLLVGEMNAQLAADIQARATKASVQAALKQKGLSLPQLEQAVRAGVSTIDQYRAALAAAGYNVDAQDQLVSLLQLRMATDQQILASKGRAAALIGQAGLSLVDLERAVKLGVIPMATYTHQLAKAGVSSDDAQLLTLSLAAQLKATKAALATKAAAAKQLSDAGLSLAKLEADILAGRLTAAQLGGVLAGAGVSTADQTTILTLIDDEIANQKALADLEGKANAAAGAKGLSLTQEQEAVKQGVKTIDEYQAFVTALNFAPADVDTLVATLAARLQLTPPAAAAPTVP